MTTPILHFMLGLLFANANEWLMHKYILHGLGKRRQSFWAYHLYEHHAICNKYAMLDEGYRRIDFRTWNTQTKELAVLAAIALTLLPLFVVLPYFIGAVYGSLLVYYYKHRKAHLDPDWAKARLRWHYDHHLGYGEGNWCITWPWFDYLLGTRIK